MERRSKNMIKMNILDNFSEYSHINFSAVDQFFPYYNKQLLCEPIN